MTELLSSFDAAKIVGISGQGIRAAAERGAIKYIAQFPQVSIYRNLSLHLTRLEQEFGLTPSARTRIAVANDQEVNDDPLENFLQQKPKIG